MIPYSFRQLEAFLWVARLGSFRAAAARLHVTQPTVSQRLREFEQAVGTTLFDRSTYRATLTREGVSLVHTVERILDLTGELDRAASPDRALRGLLRIGAMDTFALVCLPGFLSMLERQYPELEVELSVRYSRSLFTHLIARDLDVVFLTDPEPVDGITAIPLGNIDLVWVASPTITLADRELRPADLANFRLITNPPPSGLYRSIHAWFERAGVVPNRLSTCDTLSVITRLVVGSVGVSLLPHCILGAEIESGLLRPLRTRPPIEPHVMHAAFPTELAGPGLDAVVAAARAVLDETQMLSPLSGPPRRSKSASVRTRPKAASG